MRALAPLPERPAELSPIVSQMQPYHWTINEHMFKDRVQGTAFPGQRVALSFHNMSMVAHPIHLHRDHFQVVAINGNRFSGALRDTVHMPPMSKAMVTVALDADEAAEWMLHCHHLLHLASAMMAGFSIST